jgi:hypothetical protein
MLSLSTLLLTHVPGYGGDCEFNCCHPPHPTKLHVSQAVYLRGTAGIEIDLVDIQDYIDEGKNIEFSVVFREEYSPLTFDVLVGCGGCASLRTPDGYHGWDQPNYTHNLWPKPMTYQSGVFEPFTQHAYFPLLPKGQARMFNAGQLKDCDSDHFSIRVVTYDNATHDLTYSIALGCEGGLQCEEFTFRELFLFPLYVIRSHGAHWNEAGYTLPLIGIVVLIIYVAALYWSGYRSWLFLYEPVAILQPNRIYDAIVKGDRSYTPRFGQLPCVSWKPSPRAVIYAFVVGALVVDLFESLTHFFIAIHALNKGSQPYEMRGVGIYFGLVLGFGKIAPLVLVALVWRFHRAIPEFVWRTYSFKCVLGRKWEGFGFYSPMWAHGAWSIVEILFLGGPGLIWLGAGYWIFPFGMLLAGTYRLGVWLVNPSGYRRGVQFRYPAYDGRWLRDDGACTDETKRLLLDIYNSYYDARSYAKDGSGEPLMRPPPETRIPEGEPMPMMDDEDKTSPPAYSDSLRVSSTRALSVTELAQLGRR